MTKQRFIRRLALFTAGSVLLASCGGSENESSRQRNAALNVSNVAINRKAAMISAGTFSSLVIDDQGALYGFGYNVDGQVDIPSLRDGATRFTDIVASYNHSLALDDQGNLYQWGRIPYGLNTPPLKEGATRFTSIAASPYLSLALDDQGNIYTWGWSVHGQMDLPSLAAGARRFIAISASTYFSMALDDLGNIYVWGISRFGVTQIPPLNDGATRFTAISTGVTHALALDDQGNLYAWGQNNFGLLATPNLMNGSSQFTAISGGNGHSLALDDQGNVYSWGWNEYGQTNVPSVRENAERFVAISGGGAHSLALDDQGNIYAWGWNEYGQTNIPAALSPVYARSMPIAMGGVTAYGIEDTGAISTFAGSNWLFENSNYISIAAGPRHGLALTRSGTVEGWGDSEVGQLNIPDGLSGVVQVAAGYAYSAALISNGDVVEWGSHTAPTGNLITKPDDLPKIRQLAAGLTHLLGVTVDGKVVGWGDNTGNKATPPEDLDQVAAVAANGFCSMALRENGDLRYWGTCFESFEKTASLPGATAVALSDLAAAAIVNGEIVTWGEDANELLAAPEGNNYVALSAGTSAFLAVTDDGKVVTWGSNYGDPITIPESFGGPAPVVNDEICLDCEVETQEFVLTDEMIKQDAAFYTELLTPAQQKTFIEALGGNTSKPVTPEEIQALVDAATAAEREKSRQALAAALAAQSAPVESVAKTLPASKSPLTKVGARISTKKAVTLLSLKKVTKVSFVKPKKASKVCTVTTTRVTAKSSGTCNVKVRYTDSKKKVRTKTLTLSIG